MKVDILESSAVERTVEIQVESKRVDSSYERQMQRILREIKLPGFRKGKAPRKMAERYANPQALQQGVFDDVVVSAYQEAVTTHKLAPITQPRVELVQMEQGKDLIFKASFEVFPTLEVNVSEYEGLEVGVPQVEVREEDINRVLDDIRKKHQRTVAVEEARGLEKTDLAVVSFSSHIDGTAVPNGAAENFQLDLEAGLFIEGFADNLLGLKAGEKKSFTVDFPAEYANKDLAGKAVTFDFELHSVKVRELPALDDELAKEASPFATFAELYAHIRARAERALRQDIGNRALEQMAESREVPVPRSYVDRRAYMMLQNQAQQLQQYGIRFEDFIKMQNLSVEKIIEDLRPSAERLARVELLLAAVIDTEHIDLGDNDFDAEAALWAQDAGVDLETFKAHLKQSNQIEQFKNEAIRSRVRDLVASKVKAVLKVEEPATEDEQETKAEAAPKKKSKKAESAAEESVTEAAAEAAPKKPRARKKADGEA